MAPASDSAAQTEAGALVVFVVVDQLRADLLDEYDNLFSGGLRRLRDQGLRFTQVTHDHSITETSPGHATLATGTYPSRHGMVSNQWFERTADGWMSVLNVEHEAHAIVGDSFAGGGSPQRLMRTGIADWIRDADDDSRVVSISGKARAAVLLGGKAPGDVFWYDEPSSGFSTSTYYRSDLPGWLEDFNEEWIESLEEGGVWESSVPFSARSASRPDTAQGEGDGVHTAFPHVATDEGYSLDEGYWLADIPNLDRAVLQLARVAIQRRDLGDDDTVDYLALGLSAVDRVGHNYGPRSREQLDNLLRLDRELGAFLNYLDAEVGEGNYTVVVSSDHGVMDLPESSAWNGSARRLEVDDRFEVEQLLGRVVREERGGGEEAIADRLATEMAESFEWIARAWPIHALGESGDSMSVLQARSYYEGRRTGVLGRFGVVYQLTPATLDWNWATGTHHGSPYLYDRTVPLIFLGPGLMAAERSEPVSTTAVAPTIAELLGIETPDDLDGRALRLRP